MDKGKSSKYDIHNSVKNCSIQRMTLKKGTITLLAVKKCWHKTSKAKRLYVKKNCQSSPLNKVVKGHRYKIKIQVVNGIKSV